MWGSGGLTTFFTYLEMVLLQVILTRLSFGLQKTVPIRRQSLLQFFVVNQFSRCGKMWDKELLRKPHNLAMESNSRILQSKCIKTKLLLSKKGTKKSTHVFDSLFCKDQKSYWPISDLCWEKVDSANWSKQAIQQFLTCHQCPPNLNWIRCQGSLLSLHYWNLHRERYWY